MKKYVLLFLAIFASLSFAFADSSSYVTGIPSQRGNSSLDIRNVDGALRSVVDGFKESHVLNTSDSNANGQSAVAEDAEIEESEVILSAETEEVVLAEEIKEESQAKEEIAVIEEVAFVETSEAKEEKEVEVAQASSNEIVLDPESWWAELWSDVHFSYDVYIRSTLLRSGYNAGGGISFGVTTNIFRFEAYGQGDYFFTPMGNASISPLEFDVEAGITLGWKILEVGNFDVYIAGDLGYFMQFTRYHKPEDLFINENGIMFRAKLLTELPIVRYYTLALGVYYQTPIYPSYSDYNGFGIMFSFA